MSAYVWNEKESRKQKNTRRKEEREAEAKDAEALRENLLASSGVDLGPLPSSLAASGRCEQRLTIPDGCAGILIGKKGENLKSIEKRFPKVTIRVEDENSEKDTAAGKRRVGPLKGATLQVVLSGDAAGSVAAAARELDFVVETIEVAAEMSGWAVGRGGKHLNRIRELSGVAVLNFDRGDRKKATKEPSGDVAEDVDEEDEEDANPSDKTDGPPAAPCKFEIKGQRDTVADAKLLLEAHLGYYPVYQEMQEAEDEMNKEILQAQGLLGRTSRRPRQDGAAAGGRGAKRAGDSGGAQGRGRGGGGGSTEGGLVGGGSGRGKGVGRGDGERMQAGDGGRGRGGRIWSRAQKATEAEADAEPEAS